MRRLVSVMVPGRARTKGSMVAVQPRVMVGGRSLGVGYARMKESTAHSKEWRAEVAWMVRQRIGAASPYDGAVSVTVMSFLAQPKSNRDPDPTAQRSGDVDKIARNVLDALVDAGALRDDAQVTSLHSFKRWVTAGHDPYTVVEIFTYEESD